MIAGVFTTALEFLLGICAQTFFFYFSYLPYTPFKRYLFSPLSLLARNSSIQYSLKKHIFGNRNILVSSTNVLSVFWTGL